MATFSYLVSPLTEHRRAALVAAAREIIESYANRSDLRIEREFLEAPGDQYENWQEDDWRLRPLGERPVGRQLIDLLRSGDGLIVEQPFLHLDTQLLPLADAWHKQGIVLHLAKVGLPLTSGFWRAMKQFAVAAEMFGRRKTSELTSAGMAASKARGGPRGGLPTPGWKHVGPENDRRRVPDLEQRKVMERIMQLRAMGWGWRRISSYLTEHRVMWKKPNASAPRGFTLEYWDQRRCQRGYEEMLRIIAQKRAAAQPKVSCQT